VGSHHERIDGSGYPNKLTGSEIPFGAKIISVADAFDAMVSDRHYRRKSQKDAAEEQLILGKGTQFDKDVVDCFIDISKEDPEAVNAIPEGHNK
jgi:HD-GYP domain-containing protein (c-di-GMP phosphodiesterase class II)